MSRDGQIIRICFVCLGNICRSPTAEGVMKKLIGEANLADRIAVESAGTSASFHAGEPTDRRSAAAARLHGVELDGCARQWLLEDFDRFEYVVAMDRRNYGILKRMARSPDELARVSLFRAFDPDSVRDGQEDVPDPYLGEDNFDVVFDICRAGCAGLLATIIRQHGL